MINIPLIVLGVIMLIGYLNVFLRMEYGSKDYWAQFIGGIIFFGLLTWGYFW